MLFLHTEMSKSVNDQLETTEKNEEDANFSL